MYSKNMLSTPLAFLCNILLSRKIGCLATFATSDHSFRFQPTPWGDRYPTDKANILRNLPYARVHQQSRVYSSEQDNISNPADDSAKPKGTGSSTSRVITIPKGISADWMSKLRTLLDNVEPLGTFATSGPLESIPYPLPHISIEGIGRIAFPVLDVAPLKAVAIKAPFGRGTETIVDDNVRQAWQIDAKKITIAGGTVWEDYLNNLVRKVCWELGMSNERIDNNGVHATLYKILLYEKGGHFLPHRDSEKEVGMFGTLVIQLPSEFTGGAITANHDGETKTFVMSEGSLDKFQYLAFYADCEHQLHPVESGFRVCLVYNLVSKQSGALPSHAINKDTESKLRLFVDQWKREATPVSKLGYKLDHEYTPSSFDWLALKGRDEIVKQTVANAKTSSGDPLFNVHLLLMERYVQEGEDYPYQSEPWADELHAIKVINSSGVTIVKITECMDNWSRDEDMFHADDWIMYEQKDEWLVPMAEYKWDTDDDVDDLIRDSMFHSEPAKVGSQGDYGNEAVWQEKWYFASAIVISPTWSSLVLPT